jgi:hypothetical protein
LAAASLADDNSTFRSFFGQHFDDVALMSFHSQQLPPSCSYAWYLT